MGYYGVGLQPGDFGDIVANPPVQQSVLAGWIPSYSYGYTAGAWYRDMIMSTTLGGVDTARYKPHDTTFTLVQSEGLPRPKVRGIELSRNDSSADVLLDYSNAITAVIDSTTPYMWLPENVCDSFAKALNLTYDADFDLYTITNATYAEFTSKNNSMSFTFSLSSFDNTDNLGQPLSAPGVVNITVPVQAFTSLLQFPFKGINRGQPAVPYFSLRKAKNDTSIIGRSFMQEAYLITKYDENVFSVHQANFPSDPIGGAHLQAIQQPPNSRLTPPPAFRGGDSSLSTGAMVGIAVGVVVFCILAIAACFCYRRRRRAKRAQEADLDDGKDSASTLTPETPRTPVSRILSRIGRRRRSRRNVAGAGAGTLAHPSEAPNGEIYELPAPVGPAELDAGGSDDHSMVGETELGTDTQNLSAYELARLKLDRQLAGPVPAYSPPEDGLMPPPEKSSIPDLQAEATSNRQPSPVSPTRSRGADSASNTLPGSEPSPVSPRGAGPDWSTADLPSPVTASMSRRSQSSLNGVGTRNGRAQSNTSRTQSVTSSNTPVSPITDTLPPLPTTGFQRTPIDPSKVVCLGPLPENVQLPGAGPTQPSHTGPPPTSDPSIPAGFFSARSMSVTSLGSNFTEEEAEMSRQVPEVQVTKQPDSPNRSSSNHSGVSSKSSGSGRIDPGRDLIHVPQMADRRYSWEEERSR